ncbi:hypothetical protein BH23CHL8_BH23CHL8_19000 [soil metagenome]
MGMDTRTGSIREVPPDEARRLVDAGADVESVRQALAEDPAAEVPAEVLVPPSYLPLTPEQRLALMFGGSVHGKDRKAAHRGQGARGKAKRRAQRKAGRRR